MENKDLPAFPIPSAANENGIFTTFDSNGGDQLGGLTKREYIAIKAMQGMLASYPLQIDVQNNDPRYNGQNFAIVIAMNAKEFADALLNELEKETTQR